ncbi:MAG: ABC transporter substrate-binding protein [Candidatus Sericytochromatia bacterium]
MKHPSSVVPRFRQTLRLAGGLGLSALLLTGCPQLPEDSAEAAVTLDSSQIKTYPLPEKYDPVPGKSQDGDMRIISSVSLPKTFNAYLAAETSSTDVMGQMYLGLISTDPITTETIPSLAESWTLSDDKRTYTFKLREGLKWSDGQPLTADDVVFTYKEIIDNKDIPNNYRDGILVDDIFPVVKKIDERTVSFTTHKPFVPFLRGLGDPIMPKHIFEGTTKKDAKGDIKFNQMWGLNSNVDEIVVSGPWRLSDYKAGQRIVLEPNPNYYLKDKTGTQLPYLKKFITIEVQDQSTEIIKFMAEETDALSLRAEDYDILEPMRDKGKFTIANLGPATGTLFVMFNQSTALSDQGKPVVNPIKSAWFRNKAFRQALAHAVDKEGMIQSIYKGRALPQFSHISQLNPFYNPNTKQYDYNLEKAQDLLSAAGFKKNANGELHDPKGNRVEFNLVTNAGNTMRDASCAILRRDWSKLGIKVNYQPVQFNIMVQQIDQTLDWEVMMIGLTGSAIEPHFGINSWKLDGRMHMFNMGHPAEWKGKKGTSFEPWEKEVLALYEKAAVEFDFEKRKQYYWESQEIVADNLPFIYTVNQLSLVAFRNNLGNIFPSIHGGSALNVINWNTDAQFIQE